MTLNIASTQRSPIAKLAEGIAKTHQETTAERSHTAKELDINIELYSTGFFDGLNGLDAQLPHFIDYWDGYQLSYREYCCGNRWSDSPAEGSRRTPVRGRRNF